MAMFTAVEITFAKPVEISNTLQRDLVNLVDAVCKNYELHHPDRVMWPFGIGFKPTYIPMTAEEEAAGRSMEFDEGTFQIECSERENYDFPCAKCGIKQGDHGHCITQPPAGDCEFEALAAKERLL